MNKCKLDSPVHIDDTNVSLRLTNNINYPSVGSDVVAIGFGTMSSGGSQPIFLRDVTVKVDSNSKCALAPNNLYNANTISQGIICACKYITIRNQIYTKVSNARHVGMTRCMSASIGMSSFCCADC